MNSPRLNSNYHPFHLVDISPWPILMSLAILSGALSLINWLTNNDNENWYTAISKKMVILILILWLRDIIREGLAGNHTIAVRRGILLGFKLFLLTEILLFASFFWAFFHVSLNPSIELAIWPPLGINAIDSWGLPLLNSLLLLSAGFIITWAHHSFINNYKDISLFGMIISVILIIIFLGIQYIEYSNSEFTIADSVYGTIFFSLTGLHGLHVMAAVILISVSIYRIYCDHITSEHALGLDLAILYFHFTDIIWLLLYAVLYYWGNN